MFEYQDELDMDIGDGKYLAPDADRSVRNKYILHSLTIMRPGPVKPVIDVYCRPNRHQWYGYGETGAYKVHTIDLVAPHLQ